MQAIVGEFLAQVAVGTANKRTKVDRSDVRTASYEADNRDIQSRYFFVHASSSITGRDRKNIIDECTGTAVLEAIQNCLVIADRRFFRNTKRDVIHPDHHEHGPRAHVED